MEKEKIRSIIYTFVLKRIDRAIAKSAEDLILEMDLEYDLGINSKIRGTIIGEIIRTINIAPIKDVNKPIKTLRNLCDTFFEAAGLPKDRQVISLENQAMIVKATNKIVCRELHCSFKRISPSKRLKGTHREIILSKCEDYFGIAIDPEYRESICQVMNITGYMIAIA
jgi:hypothetical protein